MAIFNSYVKITRGLSSYICGRSMDKPRIGDLNCFISLQVAMNPFLAILDGCNKSSWIVADYLHGAFLKWGYPKIEHLTNRWFMTMMYHGLCYGKSP